MALVVLPDVDRISALTANDVLGGGPTSVHRLAAHRALRPFELSSLASDSSPGLATLRSSLAESVWPPGGLTTLSARVVLPTSSRVHLVLVLRIGVALISVLAVGVVSVMSRLVRLHGVVAVRAGSHSS